MERFVARNSRWRMAAMVLAMVAFAAASLWATGIFGEPLRPGREGLGWVGAVVFTLAASLLAPRLFDDRDMIVIDDRGFTWRKWSDDHIPWEEVTAIDERRIGGQVMFGMHLRDLARYPATTYFGRLVGLNRAMGFAPFTVSATGTDRTAAELREALVQFGRGLLEGER